MSHIDYRDQLDAEYNELIARMNRMISDNERIIEKSRSITSYRKNNMQSGGIRKEAR